MASSSYFRTVTVLVAMIAAAVVAGLLAGYGTASAQSTTNTTITVNTTDDQATPTDDDNCSLREAIHNANADDQVGSDDCPAGSGADIITFSVKGTISLAPRSDVPTVTEDLTIDGPGAARLAIRQHGVPSGDGAVLVMAAGVTLNVQDLTIANGEGVIPEGRGGGIANNGGTLNASNSAFSNNEAGFGGGIYNEGTLNVTGSTFSGNSALDGGGIYNFEGTVTVANSTFADNVSLQVEESGGGIYNNGGTVEVTNSTFSGNSANVGANLLNRSGTMTLRNTIVANPQSGESCSGTITDGTYNIDDGTSCGLSQPTSKPSTDPRLDPKGLQDNRGPTQTIKLLKGSPALNAIPKGANGCGTEIRKDQRGVKRPKGGGCEIGAVERR